MRPGFTTSPYFPYCREQFLLLYIGILHRTQVLCASSLALCKNQHKSKISVSVGDKDSGNAPFTSVE